MGRLTILLAIAAVLVSMLVYVVEQNPEPHYVFKPAQLHDLAKRGIAAHGNDTRSVVRYIVDELHGQASTNKAINLDEEWMFNNAGGAMGGMWIIHASRSTP
jgi:C-8 sterol isomerase